MKYNKKDLRLIKVSIAHYNRMIKYMKKKEKNSELYPYQGEMCDELGEAYGAEDCILCYTFNCMGNCLFERRFDRDCSNFGWLYMIHATSYSGWFIGANQILKSLHLIKKSIERSLENAKTRNLSV